MDIPRLPFTVLVLAPFHPVPDNFKPRVVSADSIEQAMSELGPSLYFPLPTDLCPAGGVSLQFESIDDFGPQAMIAKNEYLAGLNNALDYIDSAKDNSSPAEIVDGLKQWPGLPIDIAGAAEQGPSSGTAGKVDDILSMVSAPSAPPSAGGGGSPEDWRNQLEQILRQCLYNIVSDAGFRKHEAAWRGTDMLFKASGENVSLKLASVSMASAATIIERLEEELISGPPSLLLFDLPFDNSTYAMEALEKISALSESLLTPSAAWFTEKFLNISNWDELKKLSYLPNLLDGPEFAKWRKLRKSPAGEWLTMLINRPLLRHAYDADNGGPPARLREEDHLYMPPVYLLAALLAGRINETGWPGGLSGPGTSLLSGVPLREGADGHLYPVETMLSDDRASQFPDIGITPVIGAKNKDRAFVTRAATSSGGSLEHQLFLARIISLVMWCHENFTAEWDIEVVRQELEAALSKYFEKTGNPVPADLAVSASQDGQGIISISLTPDKLVDMPRRIEFSMSW